MNLFCQSVDFRNCSAQAREKLVLDIQRQRDFLLESRQYTQISDALILNTCNRLEFYFYARKYFDTSGHIEKVVPPYFWNEHKKTFYGLDVASHIFSVAGGLESQIIGENEIFCQLKSAYSFALRCESIKFMFHRLMHSAFRAAKAVKTNTNICTGALSIAQAAVELAVENCDIEKAKVFVIGSGSNAELIVKHLIRKNAEDIIIAARNKEAAQQLIKRTRGGEFLSLNELERNLSNADIIFAATSSSWPLITVKSIPQKRIKPLLLIDLSVPPNISPELADVEKVKLFNIDSLNEIIAANNLKRKNQLSNAQIIVNQHVQIFSKWLENLNTPMIAQEANR